VIGGAELPDPLDVADQRHASATGQPTTTSTVTCIAANS
jgi:hypothetical protein